MKTSVWLAWWSGLGKRRSSLYSLLAEDQATSEAGCGGAIPKGPSGGQTKSGACRSGRIEGLVGGEHVPDRFGELSGEVDLGDAGASLLAQALFVALVALTVGGVPERVHGRFEHRPAQVSWPLFGQRPAASESPDWRTLGHRPV
jgi:hypothetical protein